ncbi:MAG: DoxX family protein [Gammaproteobacteria bacterium]|nr:DoxX family protein [Gammaproteobacteria bacterium]
MNNKIYYFSHYLPEKLGNSFQCLILLLIRLYIASVFLRAGLLKLSSWSSTMYLFEYEYSVPLLSPFSAAVLGTAAEIVLPLLLITGFMTRWAALSLFAVNIIAVISYPILSKGEWALTKAYEIIPTGISFPTKGFEDHVMWSMMILVILAFGAGKISIDQFFYKKEQ